MEKFEVHILGCGSALPTTRHYPTSQVVNLRDKLFMIDCGEGTQVQFRRSKLKFSRLNHIFISHLHGDHCFGLPGLISTFGMLGRTAELYIHAHKDIERYLNPILDYFCEYLPYKVTIVPFECKKPEVVYEDRSLVVTTIPMDHRIPCCGFLFEEKSGPNHIIRDMVDFYKVPIYQMNRIKNGEDFITPEGDVIPNSRLTKPATPSRRYAYCSDTIFNEKIVEQIKHVDLLFHEATFTHNELPRARETYHTTARQAAQIALASNVKRLLIGHFSARYEDDSVFLNEASPIFPNCLLAKEGLCVDV
ncbi:ribonuclease Z [Bacteroides sedimenti]|uniref:Ribonuclease Z n=1 Tax=Bacteroides sedimenti TaxID=2136147 RepID=A0ABN6ZAG6_9BACE